MNTYKITYTTVTGQVHTVRRTGQTPESARAGFWQWHMEAAAGTAKEAEPFAEPIVEWESSVM